VLQNAPLTYLASTDSTSGDQYASTLHVWVDGVEWQEVPSFYGQPATARVFVTREDEQARTHVQFGDGVNGARLPSGVNNVLARYRYGSGADAPAAGSLTVIVQPQPNLKAIRNPVPVGGSADPDPPAQIKAYAPRSVLTLGRAVSGDDYETIAAQAPGVARARAYWAWNAAEQRTLVTIYVGDTAAAVTAARTALARAADPNRPVHVNLAAAWPIALTLALRLDPAYLAPPVKTAVQAALLDPDHGLFGVHAIRIGQSIYDSQIYAACLTVPGVLAVHGLTFALGNGSGSFWPDPAVRHDPGEGGFFQLIDDNVTLSVEGLADAG
jgi:predicted phage baseplate assembly protein